MSQRQNTGMIVQIARGVYTHAIRAYHANIIRLSPSELKIPTRFVTLDPANAQGSALLQGLKALWYRIGYSEAVLGGLRVEKSTVDGRPGTKVSILFTNKNQRGLLKLFLGKDPEATFLYEITGYTKGCTRFHKEGLPPLPAPLLEEPPKAGIQNLRLWGNPICAVTGWVETDDYRYGIGSGFAKNGQPVECREEVVIFKERLQKCLEGTVAGAILLMALQEAYEILPLRDGLVEMPERRLAKN